MLLTLSRAAERRWIIAVGDAELHLLNILARQGLAFSRISRYFTGRRSFRRRNASVSTTACMSLWRSADGCQFIMADARLANNLRPRFPFVVELSSLP